MWSTYVLLAVSFACANAFSEGAPEDACIQMKPHHHGLRAQKGAAPYTITTNAELVKGGSPIEVVISGQTPEDILRGVLVEGRDNDGNIVGKFTVPPNDPFLKPLNCGEPDNAVTHKSHSNKEDKRTITVTWIPPSNFNGDVKFRATIVKNFENFWTGVKSTPFKVSS